MLVYVPIEESENNDPTERSDIEISPPPCIEPASSKAAFWQSTIAIQR
jgi:hypothetical protein